ncbi:hypothetical protein [Nocardia asteroides]
MAGASEPTVILAARKPHHYILTVSTAAAGVFSSGVRYAARCHPAARSQCAPSDAVVLFSVGLLRGFRGRLGASPLTISQIFIDHLAEVLLDVHAADPARPTTRIYAQTEHTGTGVARLLNAFGFADTGVVTGDGYPLQMLEIPLGTIDPASVPSAPALRALLEQLRSAAG